MRNFTYFDVVTGNTSFYRWNECDLSQYECYTYDKNSSTMCNGYLEDPEFWEMALESPWAEWAHRMWLDEIIQYWNDYHEMGEDNEEWFDFDFGDDEDHDDVWCNSTLDCRWNDVSSEDLTAWEWLCESECGEKTCDYYEWDWAKEDYLEPRECEMDFEDYTERDNINMQLNRAGKIASNYDETLSKVFNATCFNGSCVVGAATVLANNFNDLNMSGQIDALLGDAAIMDILQSAVNETTQVFGEADVSIAQALLNANNSTDIARMARGAVNMAEKEADNDIVSVVLGWFTEGIKNAGQERKGRRDEWNNGPSDWNNNNMNWNNGTADWNNGNMNWDGRN